MFTVPDSGKADRLTREIHGRLEGVPLESYGATLVDIFQNMAPDIETLAMAYLLLDNAEHFEPFQIARLRELVRLTLDARIANVQIAAQESSTRAAASYSRTSKMLGWFGIGIACIATVAAILQVVGQFKHC